MKTKIRLGKPVKSIEHTSGSMLDTIWFSVYRSVDISVWSSVGGSVRSSVSSSVWTQINNSMIWRIRL